ncbi:MAG: hypothetical protein KAI66_05120 [Lentisphaeria bacterium]|nr:hypothetical protein [Lentisphaeria bacterium]
MDISTLPAQPDETAWGFVRELQEPMWTQHDWTTRDVQEGEANASAGVRLVEQFPDPDNRLDTAYADLHCFLAAGGIRVGDEGTFTILTQQEETDTEESYRIEIDAESCCILAGDTEGIRRGLFHVEDLMLGAEGPFLPIGSIARKPFIRRRISRCFFGPIKRPPKMRDELMDDVNYYPDEYLNRLAHDGVNGLWLTIEFRNLCCTRFTPEHGGDRVQRLDKLRRTVDQCLRYGIRTYIFCIEPRAWDADDPVVQRHPEMVGGGTYGNRRTFCTASETSRLYLEEATRSIFEAVPGLGGLINITHGERPTTCLSTTSAVGDGSITCPVCAEREPWEILHASLSAMECGMHAVAPEAELISWLYMPQPQGPGASQLAPWVYDIPDHTPEGVILQFNFESGVVREFFGRELVGGDYWISTPGPSPRFTQIAETARENETLISAKIQTGCSHEVASIPFVPVPSLLQRKFAAMRELGVTHTMLCWYFGNYPGLMNRAAGRLSFEDFPVDEDTFLLELAQRDWGTNAPQAVEAWRLLAEGYANYPLTNLFQYYGPMHDGPVWPLLLEPEDAMLVPTWLLGSVHTRKPWPPSGDRVGECIQGAYAMECAANAYSLPEAVELSIRLDDAWTRGTALLTALRPSVAKQPERLHDIGLAEALGIQFRSGRNILRFYLLREQMLRMDTPERLELLADMRAIAEEELANGPRLIALCEADSRLGFHSEAEGYKYFPAKIRWRMDQLHDLLADTFPAVEDSIQRGDLLFPAYTGRAPEGPSARCALRSDAAERFEALDFPADLDWHDDPTRWAFMRDEQFLYLLVDSQEQAGVILKLEPRRLFPVVRHTVCLSDANGQRGALRIPLADFDRTGQLLEPVRIDIQQTPPNCGLRTWIPQHSWDPRLRLGADNPADLGWLLFPDN